MRRPTFKELLAIAAAGFVFEYVVLALVEFGARAGGVS